MNSPPLIVAAALAWVVAFGAPTRAAEQPKHTNFVFILVDDLGWMDVSPNNPQTFYETPNIQRLAESGMRFTAAYAACPVCSPTRASIMTGKYPARTKTTDYFCGQRAGKLLPAEYQCRLDLEEVTLAEALKEAGYATFFAGKWHLGPEGFWPEDQGFDVNKGGIERGGPYGGKRYFSPYGNPRLEDGPEGEHLPDRLASETVKFIEANRDKPFLAYLSFYSVHTPLMAPQPLVEKYRKKAEALEHDGPAWRQERARKVRLVQDHAVYAGMVESMDAAVGKVLDALDRLELADNTVVIFFSDNGGLSTSEGHPTCNLPLRAGKGWIYEGGIREPCIIRAPGVTHPGVVSKLPIVSTDFYPTILDLAGLELRPNQHVDGLSLKALLTGDAGPQGFSSRVENREDGNVIHIEPSPYITRPIFWHYPHYGNQGGAPSGAVRFGAYKLIEWFEDDSIELYNVVDDIGEKHDLSKTEPQRAAKMRQMLHDWRQSVDANMPRPNPKYKPKD